MWSSQSWGAKVRPDPQGDFGLWADPSGPLEGTQKDLMQPLLPAVELPHWALEDKLPIRPTASALRNGHWALLVGFKDWCYNADAVLDPSGTVPKPFISRRLGYKGSRGTHLGHALYFRQCRGRPAVTGNRGLIFRAGALGSILTTVRAGSALEGKGGQDAPACHLGLLLATHTVAARVTAP